MGRYGFIGTGSMGSMLISRMIGAGVVAPADIIASSKTGISARRLAEKTGISAVPSNRTVASESDIIFICVKPNEVHGVIKEIQDELISDVLLVSIAGSLTLADIERWVGDKTRCARVIPSITTEQNAGISLVSWGRKINQDDKNLVLKILNAISTAVELDEDTFEVCINLTSCGPALIAAMMKEFSASAVRCGNITPELAEYLVAETLMGTAQLLTYGRMGFDDLIERVATKGGSTEEGVKIIQKTLPALMDDVHNVLCTKRCTVVKLIREGE
jgi:pyrroline-5-carboxylate reductase